MIMGWFPKRPIWEKMKTTPIMGKELPLKRGTVQDRPRELQKNEGKTEAAF